MTGEEEPSRGERWLVIGGSGFVGSSILRALVDAGERASSCPAPRVEADPRATIDQLVEACLVHPELEVLRQTMTGYDIVIVAAGRAEPDAQESVSLWGANVLLPGLVLVAAPGTGVRRVVHLSSAAVQGRRTVLTEDTTVEPFSAYSRSKAMGERLTDAVGRRVGVDCVVVRATSVQGENRPTTRSLRRVARSRLASVAAPGDQPSAVSSVDGLVSFVRRVSSWDGTVPSVVLQPWEGLSVREVLAAAGRRDPVVLPRRLCRLLLSTGWALSAIVGHRLDGPLRRVEMMWFGQEIEAVWARTAAFTPPAGLAAMLSGSGRER